MCDFAAGAVEGDALRVLVVELKSGAADLGAVEQLQEGLRVVEKQLGESSMRTQPEAYLVANKVPERLMNLLRGKSTRVKFGQFRIQVRVRRCGDVLVIGDAQ